MLLKIKAAIAADGYRQSFLTFQRHIVPLHAQITSAGIQRVNAPDYDWHGRKRGTAEFALIQYTLNGQGRLTYEQREYRVLPGQAMLLTFPHDNRYRFRPPGPPWEFIYAALCGREILRLLTALIRQQGPLLRFNAASPSFQALTGLVLDVLSGRIISPFQSSAAAYHLVMTLCDEHVGQTARGELPAGILAAKTYCREHFREQVTVADLAAVSDCSRYHFSRMFKKWTGLPPGRYLLDLRLRAAMRLLAEDNRRVKQTAHDCGFRDFNYFCRVFRKHFGISPGEVRRSGMY